MARAAMPASVRQLRQLRALVIRPTFPVRVLLQVRACLRRTAPELPRQLNPGLFQHLLRARFPLRPLKTGSVRHLQRSRKAVPPRPLRRRAIRVLVRPVALVRAVPAALCCLIQVALLPLRPSRLLLRVMVRPHPTGSEPPPRLRQALLRSLPG